VLHELLHAVPHLEHTAVHVEPLVNGRHPPDLHELSEHHKSTEARERYLARH
jgi:hypothetical protein